MALSGMGGAAARQSARGLAESGVEALVSFGMAGGLDPSLVPGTVFLPSEVICADGGAVIATDECWREQLAVRLAGEASDPGAPGASGAGPNAGRGGPGGNRTGLLPAVTRGRLLTTSKAVGTAADKAVLFHRTGAAAVDMESLAVAEVARGHGLPFIAVRVIVDAAADTLPRAVTAAADNEGHLRIGRLLGALARTPGELPALIRLGQRYRAANRSLAAVARAGLCGGRVG